MNEKFTVEIITPDRTMLKSESEEVIIPSYEGQMGILRDHIPLITFLRPGFITIKNRDNKKFFVGYFNLFNNYWIVLGTIIPILSLIGDLLQSLYKRRAKLKDSGNIIPGHGGVYDRMDSVIYSALYYYLFLKLI